MKKDWRTKINFWFEDMETPMGRAIDIIVVALVFFVSLIFVIKTYPLSPKSTRILDGLENFIVGIFIVEYILRIWSAPKRIKRFFDIYQLIDLVAILPVFFTGHGYQILRVFRALRFLRLVRFMKGQHFFFRRLKPTDIIVMRIVYIVLSIIFVSAGMIFYAESDLSGTRINTFFDAVYFSIVTLTTVGFGDITPVSNYGRFITILIIVSGVVFIPWQIRDFLKHLVSEAPRGGRLDITCKSCGIRGHESDSVYCRVCGKKLK